MAAGKLDYDFNFRAGLDGNNNAYVESSGTNFVELDLHLDAGAKGIKTTGTMGFVPYSVSTTAGAPLLDAHIGLALDDGDGRSCVVRTSSRPLMQSSSSLVAKLGLTLDLS